MSTRHLPPTSRTLAHALVVTGLVAGAACDDGGEVVSECATIDEATALEHSGAVAVDEVWAEGLHLLTGSVSVGAGALLTIDGCAVVRVGPDVNIDVDDEAVGVVAEGSAARPIVIERAESESPWGALNAFAPATVRLAHTTLRGGGSSTDPEDATFAGATLVVRNQTADLVDQLFVDTVTVEDSSGLGVMLQGTGFIAGSTDLTVTGSGTHPVYLGAGYATRLPTGDYTDNGVDAFLLQSVGAAVYENSEPILHDAVIPDRGLPYQVGRSDTGGDVIVGDGRDESPAALLTIEAGVELRFRGSNSALGQLLVNGKGFADTIQPQGALVVQGTEASPVVFTSMQSTPAAGDWQGLYFDTAVDSRSRVEHAVIRFAGGESTTTGACKAAVGAGNNDADCAVIVFTADAPPGPFFTDTAIEDSAGCGFYRGWSGDSVDLAGGNSIDAVGCDQSNVPDDTNSCDTGPCQ